MSDDKRPTTVMPVERWEPVMQAVPSPDGTAGQLYGARMAYNFYGGYVRSDDYDAIAAELAQVLERLAHSERHRQQNRDTAVAIQQELTAAQSREAALRDRCSRQRRELKRLNKVLGPYWQGFHKGLGMEAECRLRGIMNDAFGHKAVRKAEIAALAAGGGK